MGGALFMPTCGVGDDDVDACGDCCCGGGFCFLPLTSPGWGSSSNRFRPMLQCCCCGSGGCCGCCGGCCYGGLPPGCCFGATNGGTLPSPVASICSTSCELESFLAFLWPSVDMEDFVVS